MKDFSSEKEPSQVQSLEGVGFPSVEGGHCCGYEPFLLTGPWLLAVRFGANHFPSLNVSFFQNQDGDHDGITISLLWGCWDCAVRAGRAAAVAYTVGPCPPSVSSAGISRCRSLQGAGAHGRTWQVPARELAHFLSAEKDGRLGLKKISVHKRVTGVKDLARGTEGLLPDWWLVWGTCTGASLWGCRGGRS